MAEKTQQEKLAKYLAKTRKITAEQALTKFNTKNLRATVSYMKTKGWQFEKSLNRNNVTVYKVLRTPEELALPA